jgi:1-aminocyclopropane-1-carboxylate deaminase/D-cysteine desulfhydrase-like pyridoxal-dependent ACC family enzyme
VFTDLGLEMWIKRDDLTSNDLSGNKVRKLEFLLARALEGGHDSVITIGEPTSLSSFLLSSRSGGEQSNHCR